MFSVAFCIFQVTKIEHTCSLIKKIHLSIILAVNPCVVILYQIIILDE